MHNYSLNQQNMTWKDILNHPHPCSGQMQDDRKAPQRVSWANAYRWLIIISNNITMPRPFISRSTIFPIVTNLAKSATALIPQLVIHANFHHIIDGDER
ncbi:hypothetical protein PoB_001731000 [Plakobranchus ocellatus]|uniref:Uncharacterized protein n=1 Tax=Plakobranchus ocellatus TaxID=259542 RepID=A0AAV3Z8A2_9GAST|nr:hypothetical protein PoB_001731000 [Plakobranchus ocellatus]